MDPSSSSPSNTFFLSNGFRHCDSKEFAVKTSFAAIESRANTPSTPLTLRIDDEIFEDFKATFGDDFPVAVLDEARDFKSPEMKEKWRIFINRYEGGKVTDYNFGSLLRLDASEEYTESNTMFGKKLDPPRRYRKYE